MNWAPGYQKNEGREEGKAFANRAAKGRLAGGSSRNLACPEQGWAWVWELKGDILKDLETLFILSPPPTLPAVGLGLGPLVPLRRTPSHPSLPGPVDPKGVYRFGALCPAPREAQAWFQNGADWV